MPFLLYSLTAIALLWLMHRFVRRASLVAMAILFLLPFLFTGPALVANRVYAPIERTYQDPPLSDLRAQFGVGAPHNPAGSDIYTQMIPWRHVVREALARGEWPLWNPFILCGDVLAASAQSAPYSPFTLIAVLMPAAISFTFTAAITLFLAAAATFAFARELDCREGVAIFAAAGWMCSTAIVLYCLWPLGISWAMLPLVLLATHRAVHAPGVASWALLTTSFTLLILAGHPESVLHIVTIGALFGAFLWIHKRRWTAIATAFAAGATALLLCAIYLLPIWEAIPQTAEHLYRTKYLVGAEWRGASPADVTVRLATTVFPFLHLRHVTNPATSGVKAETGAVGSIVLALAIYAVWRVRSRLTWFFAALAVFCALAGTEWRPIVRFFEKLPLYDIALHERLAFASAFGFVVLAAIGLEQLLRRDDHVAAAITLALTCTVLAFGTWWIRRTWTLDASAVEWGRYKIAAELAGLAFASVVVTFHRHLPPLLLALLLVQRVVSDGGTWISHPAKAAYPPLPLFDPLQRIGEPFRVTGAGFAMIPGTNALYGLEDVRGYEAMTLMNLVETYRLWCVPQVVFFNRIDDLTRPMISMMNVRFAVTRSDAPVPNGWREIARQPQSLLLENTKVLPRAFVPRRVTIGLGNTLALHAMEKVTDFRDHGWINEETLLQTHDNGPGRVAIRRRGFSTYDIDAEMDALGWVIVSESNWRGWRAYLDGRPVRVQRANVAFLGVLVPAGKHHVRLVYRPRAFDVGLRITAVTILGLIVFAFMRRRR